MQSLQQKAIVYRMFTPSCKPPKAVLYWLWLSVYIVYSYFILDNYNNKKVMQ